MPPGIKRSYLVSNQTFNSKTIATFEDKEQLSQDHIIYFHGGAYVFEAAAGHWSIAQKIVAKSFCRMTLIDYPLAPEHNYHDTFAMVAGAYDLLIQQYPDDNFILMGDSSGGGLALAFSQKLAQEKHPKPPIKLILLSPWLDLTMANPSIEKQQNKDHVLTVNMLRNAGSKYAAADDQAQYLLSPINGTFQGLPKTIVFYGTEELFYADCIKLKSIISAIEGDFVFREYPHMQHDWTMFPIPESARVIDEICAFLKE